MSTPTKRQEQIQQAERRVLQAIRILNQWDEQAAIATTLIGPRAEWEAELEAARRDLAAADNAAFESGDNLYLSPEDAADYMTNTLGRTASVHTIRHILRDVSRRTIVFPRARSTGEGRRVTHALHIDDLRAWHPNVRKAKNG